MGELERAVTQALQVDRGRIDRERCDANVAAENVYAVEPKRNPVRRGERRTIVALERESVDLQVAPELELPGLGRVIELKARVTPEGLIPL